MHDVVYYFYYSPYPAIHLRGIRHRLKHLTCRQGLQIFTPTEGLKVDNTNYTEAEEGILEEFETSFGYRIKCKE
jgi:hypothetical protein